MIPAPPSTTITPTLATTKATNNQPTAKPEIMPMEISFLEFNPELLPKIGDSSQDEGAVDQKQKEEEKTSNKKEDGGEEKADDAELSVATIAA